VEAMGGGRVRVCCRLGVPLGRGEECNDSLGPAWSFISMSVIIVMCSRWVAVCGSTFGRLLTSGEICRFTHTWTRLGDARAKKG